MEHPVAATPKDTGQTRLDRLIRDACDREGIGLNELARDIGVNRGFLYRIMRGDKPAPERVIGALVDRLKVNPDEIRLAAGRLPVDIESQLLDMNAEGIDRVREIVKSAPEKLFR